MNESNEPVKPNALLLDDNLMSSMRLSAQLERLGYNVQIRRAVPESPLEGAAAAEGKTELVVINLGSRGLNGVQFIGDSRERFAGARVIGFCGHLEVEIRRAAKAAGIDKILTNDQAFTGLQESL